jgi:hypothetical protein
MTKHIDYAKVSQYLKEFYECDRIVIDFLELEGKMVIHKHSYLLDGKLRMGQPTSYDYSDFESITERLSIGDDEK